MCHGSSSPAPFIEPMPCPTGNATPRHRSSAPAARKVEAVVPVDALCEEVLPEPASSSTNLACQTLRAHYQLPLEDGSQALVMTDALFNLGDKPPTGLGGTLLRHGRVGPLGMSRIGRLLLLRTLINGAATSTARPDETSVCCASVSGEAITTDLAQRRPPPARRDAALTLAPPSVAALILSLLTGGFGYRWLTADPARAMRTLQC